MLRAIIVGGLLAAAPAHAYQAKNDLTVTDLGNGQFEVRPRGGLSASAAWCAMGDYALRILDLPPTTPLWRVSEPPRASGQPILFALTGDGSASKTGLVILNETDASLSAGFASELCWSTPTISD